MILVLLKIFLTRFILLSKTLPCIASSVINSLMFFVHDTLFYLIASRKCKASCSLFLPMTRKGPCCQTISVTQVSGSCCRCWPHDFSLASCWQVLTLPGDAFSVEDGPLLAVELCGYWAVHWDQVSRTAGLMKLLAPLFD